MLILAYNININYMEDSLMKKITMIVALLLALVLLVPAVAEEVPEEVIYIFGGSSDPNRAKLKKMGQQSWYPMYSIQTNAGTEIDITTFKECQLTETGLWKPNETVEVKSFEPDNENMITYSGAWFSIRKDGFLAGDTGFSAALKWVCEYDGMYDVQVSYSGGTSAGGPTESYYQADGAYIPAVDGIYMSCFIKGEMMFIEDSCAYEGYRIPQTDLVYNGVDLKAGDEIWLVADTKDNGGWDDPWWCVRITRTGALQ